jgi:hypothetical protein
LVQPIRLYRAGEDAYTTMMMRLLLILPTALLLTSCGSGLPQTIPVSGRITFDGKPPPASGSVLFLPLEAAEGFPLRPATAAFGTDGQFKAKTFEPGDGLMPGKYAMSIECWDTPPNMTGNPGKSHVPKKYQSPQSSGFTLDIAPDMRRQNVDLNVVSK